jgi:hypothetical protein
LCIFDPFALAEFEFYDIHFFGQFH